MSGVGLLAMRFANARGSGSMNISDLIPAILTTKTPASRSFIADGLVQHLNGFRAVPTEFPLRAPVVLNRAPGYPPPGSGADAAPAHCPPWVPPLPEPHTFMASKVMAGRPNDATLSDAKRRRVDARRKAGEAVVSLMKSFTAVGGAPASLPSAPLIVGTDSFAAGGASSGGGSGGGGGGGGEADDYGVPPGAEVVLFDGGRRIAPQGVSRPIPPEFPIPVNNPVTPDQADSRNKIEDTVNRRYRVTDAVIAAEEQRRRDKEEEKRRVKEEKARLRREGDAEKKRNRNKKKMEQKRKRDALAKGLSSESTYKPAFSSVAEGAEGAGGGGLGGYGSSLEVPTDHGPGNGSASADTSHEESEYDDDDEEDDEEDDEDDEDEEEGVDLLYRVGEEL
jgi:hypothetical protein